ncbi:hypothetical protein [Brevundimonas sp.]|uniref:hypothetical protein n=1 Tax=Brevundimonas sp. TaxID=1871086 RepID=UPI0025C0A2F5|nr:hypothetical protein [Brevundimonas sp.]
MAERSKGSLLRRVVLGVTIGIVVAVASLVAVAIYLLHEERKFWIDDAYETASAGAFTEIHFGPPTRFDGEVQLCGIVDGRPVLWTRAGTMLVGAGSHPDINNEVAHRCPPENAPED